MGSLSLEGAVKGLTAFPGMGLPCIPSAPHRWQGAALRRVVAQFRARQLGSLVSDGSEATIRTTSVIFGLQRPASLQPKQQLLHNSCRLLILRQTPKEKKSGMPCSPHHCCQSQGHSWRSSLPPSPSPVSPLRLGPHQGGSLWLIW